MAVVLQGEFPSQPPSPGLRVPQARVLRALLPRHADDPPGMWPCLTRAALGVRAGFTESSGSVTRALQGIREGSTSGDAHPGLIALGYVTVVSIDVDGLEETNYHITAQGIAAFAAFVAAGGALPPVKDASICTNDRYQKGESQ